MHKEVWVMTIQCCKCKKVHVDKEWIALPFGPGGAISYSYCPKCLAQTRAEFAAEMRAASSVWRKQPVLAALGAE